VGSVERQKIPVKQESGSSLASVRRECRFGVELANIDFMLMTIFVILMVLWLLGMVSSYNLYGYIHILLVIAVVVLLIRLIQGRRVL
jgi:hypothetical protein